MKLLMFQSKRFRFRTFRKTLQEASEQEVDEAVEAVAVIFVHAEDGDAERRDSLMGKARKNVKWIANKRSLRNIVLHSFTHLAESKAEPAFAEVFLEDLAGSLRGGGYGVWVTPFGYTCEWELEVFGDSLAKVFKSL